MKAKIPFDTELLKNFIQGAGFNDNQDFVNDFNKKYLDAGLDLPTFLTALKFGMIDQVLASMIGNFLDLNKEQFTALILGKGII